MNRAIEILGKAGLTLQIVKTAFAAALSWFIATSLLHAEYPFFAAVAAIITVQVTVADSVDKASQRIIGIVGGVILSMLFGLWFDVSAISIFFVILTGMAIAKALRMNPQIISQVAISSLLVLAFGQNQEGYAYERVIETILGSGIAVLINALIVPQNAIPDVEKSIQTYSRLAASTLSSLKVLLLNSGKHRKTGRSEVNALIREAQNCQKALELAEQSLKYNPLLTHKRTRLKRLAVSIHKLESITIQIRGIRRSLADLQADELLKLDNHHLQQLMHAKETTAACIAAFGDTVIDASEQNLLKLSTAIEEAQEAQSQCLENLQKIASPETLRNMGSMLTDLSRIITETERQNPLWHRTEA